jgi:hypothetical protein
MFFKEYKRGKENASLFCWFYSIIKENQIDIINNWDNNLKRCGFAFRNYMQCIAIIQTGFDVELP